MLSIRDLKAYRDIYATETQRKASKHQPFIQGIGFRGDLDLFWPQGGDPKLMFTRLAISDHASRPTSTQKQTLRAILLTLGCPLFSAPTCQNDRKPRRSPKTDERAVAQSSVSTMPSLHSLATLSVNYIGQKRRDSWTFWNKHQNQIAVRYHLVHGVTKSIYLFNPCLNP